MKKRYFQPVVGYIVEDKISGGRMGKSKKAIHTDAAEVWLRKHDPLYHDWHERKNAEYSYLTSRQMKRSREKEIPVGLIKHKDIQGDKGTVFDVEVKADK